jgi:membrane-associated protease RseP (regulator of RpoE activity)
MNPKIKTALIHLSLFVAALITTTLAGAEWTYGKSILLPGYTWNDFLSGLPYSICFLSILTAHEFGHYFAAMYHRVKTTLPYYIPLPPLPMMLGTLGALIRIKQKVRTTTQNFDIGIAGPLTGFVFAIGFLGYSFTHLPPPEYIFTIHPEYEQYGLDYAQYVYKPGFLTAGTLDVYLGKNLLYIFFEKVVSDPTRIPNVHEIIHYPFLFAGFLSLIFTSINLLPIGQLDGGHVLYGLVGFNWHRKIATIIFLLFLFYAGLGFVHPADGSNVLIFKIPLFVGFNYLSLRGLHLSKRDTLIYALSVFALQYGLVSILPNLRGYSGWLLFTFIIGRFIGITHPPSDFEEKLTTGRVVLGWITLLIFVICFAPNPLEIIEVVGNVEPAGVTT